MKFYYGKRVALAMSLLLALIVLGNFTFIGSQYGQTLEEMDPNVQWEFFEGEFINPKNVSSYLGKGERISIPNTYKEHYSSYMNYGTYIAKVKIKKSEKDKNLAVYVPYQYGSYKLFVNDQLVALNGELGTSKEQQVPEMAPKIGQISFSDEEVIMTLQLANFHSIRGGFVKPIYIGDFSSIVKSHNSAILFQFFILGVIFIVGILSLIIGWLNGRNSQMMLFAAMCFILSVRSLYARPFIYSITVLNVPWHIAAKIEAAGTILALIVGCRFVQLHFEKMTRKWIVMIVQLTLVGQLFMVIMTEPVIFQKTFNYIIVIPYLFFLAVGLMIVLSKQQMAPENSVHFIGMLILFGIAIYDYIVVYNLYQMPLLLQYGQTVYVLIFIVYISRQMVQKQKVEYKLKREIIELNKLLDKKVKVRTQLLEEANSKLELLASQDALTGIGNRLIFDKSIDHYFEFAKKQNSRLAVYLIDIDEFKRYNDYYGHLQGDELLRECVKVIGSILPKEAIFARYGGEEFVIIYPDATEEQFKQLGEQVVRVVADYQFEHANREIGYVTVSVGGSFMDANNPFETKVHLLKEADDCLYKAKNNGRNQFALNESFYSLQ